MRSGWTKQPLPLPSFLRPIRRDTATQPAVHRQMAQEGIQQAAKLVMLGCASFGALTGLLPTEPGLWSSGRTRVAQSCMLSLRTRRSRAPATWRLCSDRRRCRDTFHASSRMATLCRAASRATQSTGKMMRRKTRRCGRAPTLIRMTESSCFHFLASTEMIGHS